MQGHELRVGVEYALQRVEGRYGQWIGTYSGNRRLCAGRARTNLHSFVTPEGELLEARTSGVVNPLDAYTPRLVEHLRKEHRSSVQAHAERLARLAEQRARQAEARFAVPIIESICGEVGDPEVQLELQKRLDYV